MLSIDLWRSSVHRKGDKKNHKIITTFINQCFSATQTWVIPWDLVGINNDPFFTDLIHWETKSKWQSPSKTRIWVGADVCFQWNCHCVDQKFLWFIIDLPTGGLIACSYLFLSQTLIINHVLFQRTHKHGTRSAFICCNCMSCSSLGYTCQQDFFSKNKFIKCINSGKRAWEELWNFVDIIGRNMETFVFWRCWCKLKPILKIFKIHCTVCTSFWFHFSLTLFHDFFSFFSCLSFKKWKRKRKIIRKKKLKTKIVSNLGTYPS